MGALFCEYWHCTRRHINNNNNFGNVIARIPILDRSMCFTKKYYINKFINKIKNIIMHIIIITHTLFQNADSISDYPVSFHYITGNRMVEFDHFIYRVHVYGIVGGLQSVNPTVASSSEPTKTAVSPSSKLKRTEGPRN